MENFGQKIRRLRKAKKMTQAELAESVGVDFTYISKIENGKGVRPPSEETLRKIALFLETDAEELLLLAKKVPQNFQETIVDDKLAVDFLRIFPKLNNAQREQLQKIIEQHAAKILLAEKISSPPISAERLAEFYFDLDIEWRRLENDNVAAALSVSEKKIYINELITNIGLRNFTVAHELGHWVLHRNLIGKRSPQIEREADIFAVYLLMPEEMIREEFTKIRSPFTWCDLYDLAKKFCVSTSAMKIRLSQWELKLIYVDKDGNIYRSREEFLERKAGQTKLF